MVQVRQNRDKGEEKGREVVVPYMHPGSIEGNEREKEVEKRVHGCLLQAA